VTWFASSTNQAAAIAAHAEVITFVELDFPSGYVRLHNRTGTIAWGTASPIPQWLGVGKLGSVDTVAEDAELRPNTVRLTLSGVDSSLVSSAMTEGYHGRSVAIYDGFLNTTTLALLATPELRFRGMMDSMSVELGAGTASIVVTCESELARWDRPRGLLYTSESQQLIYPGDKGFDMVPTMQNRNINWVHHDTTIGSAVARAKG
jgi:hypothetical protein